MMKLFRAQSEFDNFLGYDSVKIYWFCGKRSHPIGPYDKIIKDYGSMSPEQRPSAEEMVEEYFTADEIEQLQAYAEREGHGLEVREESLPIDISDWMTVEDCVLIEWRTSHIYWVRNPQKEGLSFSPCLYCCTCSCPPTTQLLPGDADDGQKFVECLLEKLNIPITGNIQKAVEELYDDHGLHIITRSTIDGQAFAWELFSKLGITHPSLDLEDVIQTIYDETDFLAMKGKRKSERIEEQKLWLAEQEKWKTKFEQGVKRRQRMSSRSS